MLKYIYKRIGGIIMKLLEFVDGIERDQSTISLEEVHGNLFLMVTDHYGKVTVVDLSNVGNSIALSIEIERWCKKQIRQEFLSVLNPQWEELKKENK